MLAVSQDKRLNPYVTLPQKRNTSFESSPQKDKVLNKPVLLSTALGTVLPVLAIRKYQGKSLSAGALTNMSFLNKSKELLKSFNIEYGLKEMVLTSFGSISGGLLGGLAFEKDENKKSKIKESVFQFLNIAIPTTFVAGLLKATEKQKGAVGVLCKIASVLGGVGFGMPLAAKVSNGINNTFIDKANPDKRQLKLKDCFVHADDLFSTLILLKIPFAEKIQADKILPVLYGMCGYEAGNKK